MRLPLIHLLSLLSSKLTQPHLFTNNMFPPINAHSRPPSEDLRGITGNVGATDVHSASKQQQLRRQQQTMEQQRRSPLRSNSLLMLTPTVNRVAITATPTSLVPSPTLAPTDRRLEPGKSELDPLTLKTATAPLRSSPSCSANRFSR